MKRLLWFVLSKVIAVLKFLQQTLRHLLKNLERLKFIYYEFKPRPNDFATFFKHHFIRNGFTEIGSWFQHTAGWLNRRNDPNILYLSYEEMKTDLRSCLYKISDFCGFEIDPARLPNILHRCSFGFMKQYEEKFDPAMAATLARPVQPGAFIREGSAGGWSEHFSAEQQAIFDRYFRKYLSRKIGLLKNFSMPHTRPMEVRR